jgi:CRP-like cAMP-binding protein
MSRLPAGSCVLISPLASIDSGSLELGQGIARVFCACPDSDGMTIGFLQAGEAIRPDRLCSDSICMEAITDVAICQLSNDVSTPEMESINEWTMQLLRIHHLGRAEHRLQALICLLVNRLGKRCGDWCVLPFRPSHERIAELIGTTRVTTTRLLSRLRAEGQILIPSAGTSLYINPHFLDVTPQGA